MSEKKSLLDKLKAVIAQFADAAPVAYKLADGTDVTISLLDIGGDFLMGGMPAPEGTYTLMDGTNVMVDSTGKITAVEEPTEFAGTEYTLADLTKVSIDKMEVGGQVMQGTTPIANGEYTLDNGDKFTTVDGLITVITPKPADTKMSKEQIKQMYDDTIAAAPTDQIGKLTVCVKALMDYCFGWQLDDPNYNPTEQVQDAQQIADAVNVYKQGLAKAELKLQKQSETITEILQLMTEFAAIPSNDPPAEVTKKVRFSGDVQQTKKTAVSRYAAAAQRAYEKSQETKNTK